MTTKTKERTEIPECCGHIEDQYSARCDRCPRAYVCAYSALRHLRPHFQTEPTDYYIHPPTVGGEVKQRVFSPGPDLIDVMRQLYGDAFASSMDAQLTNEAEFEEQINERLYTNDFDGEEQRFKDAKTPVNEPNEEVLDDIGYLSDGEARLNPMDKPTEPDEEDGGSK